MIEAEENGIIDKKFDTDAEWSNDKVIRDKEVERKER